MVTSVVVVILGVSAYLAAKHAAKNLRPQLALANSQPAKTQRK